MQNSSGAATTYLVIKHYKCFRKPRFFYNTCFNILDYSFSCYSFQSNIRFWIYHIWILYTFCRCNIPHSSGRIGSYTTGSVPGLVDPIDASNGTINSAGWTLIVAYQNGTLPARNLTIYVAGNRVSADTGSADVAVSGFLTPAGGPVSGRLF